MEVKTIIALFDMTEHTGTIEDRFVTEYMAELKKSGFKSYSNIIVIEKKEDLYNHNTDMIKQIIVMMKPGTAPIYTQQ